MHFKDPRGNVALTDMSSGKVWTTQNNPSWLFKDRAMKDLQLEEKNSLALCLFKTHSLSLSVSRVGQMQQGKATSWRGQGKTEGRFGGGEC